ncbi:MAG TPA: hypothetical protein DHM37_02825 [Candidatus Cloacimonas sp.]|nr:hypothetical protein [Candidatus Cloacimonas sp.]
MTQKNKPKSEQNINKLCKKCIHNCKQTFEVILLGCPNFEYKSQQLEFKFVYPKRVKNENNSRET